MAALSFPSPTQLKNISGPTVGSDAATKTYVDTQLSSGSATVSAAGSNTYIQYNNAGALGANSNFVFNSATSLLTLTGNASITGNVSANILVSTVAQGTAPLTVTSNIKVTNLNADLLDGYNTATANTATTVAVRDANGNVSANYFSGNGYYLTGIDTLTVSGADVANRIANGTSNIDSPTANGNITVGIGGSSNTVIFTSTGVNVAGTLNVGGNVIVGNLTVSGTTTTVNSTTTRVVDPMMELGGGANGAALSTDDNKDRGLLLHYYTSGTATDAFMGWDDSNAEFAFGSNVTVSSEVVTFNTYANVRGDYIIGNGYYLTGVDQLSAGTADIANSIANGTSNVSTPVANGNITVTIGGVANTVVFTSTGINVAGNITTAGSGGNLTGANYVTANYFVGDGSGLTNIPAANINGSYANSNVASYLPTHTGNINANVFNGNGESRFWNGTYVDPDSGVGRAIKVGNLGIAVLGGIKTDTLTATGNISGNFFTGNGYYLTGIDQLAAGSADIANSIANGTSNINTPILNGNIRVSIGGTSNTVIFTSTGINVAGYISPSTGSGTNGIIWPSNPGGGTGDVASIKYYAVTGEQTRLEINVQNDVPGASQDDIYFTTNSYVVVNNSTEATSTSSAPFQVLGGAGIAKKLYVGGNIEAGTNYIKGNGYYLTGVDQLAAGTADIANSIANGTSNINTPTANGNITVGVGGVSNTVIFTSTGVNVTGHLTATGNVSAGSNYVLGNGFYLTGISAGSGSYANSNVASYLPTHTGNVSANFFIGNGSQLTGIVGSYSNTNTAAYLPTHTGNITAGNANLGNAVTANYFIGNGALLTGIDTSNTANKLANGTSNVNIPASNGNVTFGVGGSGNIVVVTSTGLVVTGSGSISVAGGSITGGTLTGPLTTNAQPNITSVGTLTALNVSGTITHTGANANLGNVARANYFVGDGSLLSNVITGVGDTIANGTSNITVFSTAVALSASSVANVLLVFQTGANINGYANITGNASIGNITTAGIIVSSIATGTAPLTVTSTTRVANLNVANSGYSDTAGNVVNAAQPNITSLGTLANLTVTGSVNLGTASNITIGGGAADYFLKTDGGGNLSWAVPSGGGGGGGSSLTYTAGTTPPASGNLLGDQWFNTSGNVLYEYINDGTASYWVDISGATTTTTTPTTLDLANVSIAGGSNGQAIISNGAGGVSFATLTSNIYNGNSNVTVVANSNVTFSIAGTANVLTVSSTGANLISTGTANLGNLATSNYVAGTLTTAAQPNITSVGTLANLTVSGTTSYGLSADILLTKTGATGTVVHDLSTGALFYHTNPAANFTVNFTNVPTTEGRMMTVTLLISQGATPYVTTVLQIDSFIQTIKWVAGIIPTGNANKTDVISFSLTRTGGSWIVYGQSTYYG